MVAQQPAHSDDVHLPRWSCFCYLRSSTQSFPISMIMYPRRCCRVESCSIQTTPQSQVVLNKVIADYHGQQDNSDTMSHSPCLYAGTIEIATYACVQDDCMAESPGLLRIPYFSSDAVRDSMVANGLVASHESGNMHWPVATTCGP